MATPDASPDADAPDPATSAHATAEAIDPARLRAARGVWWAAAAVLTVVAVVAPVTVPDPASTVPPVLPAALGLSVAAAALAGVVALDRGLVARAPSDAAEAGRELTSRLVLQVAVLEAPALLTVVLAAVIGPPWVVLTGALPALAGLWLVRPSRGRLRRLASAWDDVRAVNDAR